MKQLWVILESWTENFLMDRSILERLILGIGLGFFSLVTLYVLLFKSSITRSLPRVLFRLALILIVIVTSTISYFALVQSLIHQSNDNPIPPPSTLDRSQRPTSAKGRADTIRQLEKDREKKIDEMIGP